MPTQPPSLTLIITLDRAAYKVRRLTAGARAGTLVFSSRKQFGYLSHFVEVSKLGPVEKKLIAVYEAAEKEEAKP